MLVKKLVVIGLLIITGLFITFNVQPLVYMPRQGWYELYNNAADDIGTLKEGN